MARGRVREVSVYLNFVHVAVQSSGKLRLFLDLSHLTNVSSRSPSNMKILDVFSGNVLSYLRLEMSAYHHIQLIFVKST